jgi:hypothetical protein|tara:strand:+ start:678 stop:1205 length:528 start_codon:yes stop_codon:yes gene_type:complete
MTYEIKALKTFHGHDGYGWEGKLYHDGKAVALVVEDGWGGELQFHWNDHDAPRVATKGVDYEGQPMTYRDTPEESTFRTHCLGLPKWENFGGKMVHASMDVAMGDMVDTKLAEKEVKKLLKKAAIYDGKDIRTFNAPIDQSGVRDHLAKKCPDAIILNDLPFSEVVEFYEGLQQK